MWQRFLQISVGTLLCAVLFGVCIQAPISVVADTQLPTYALLIKAWKEMLLGVTAVLVAVTLWQTGKWRILWCEPAVWLCVAIAAIHIAVLCGFANNQSGEMAALLVTLRIYFAAALGYSAVVLWPSMRKPLLGAAAVGVVIVSVVALLQVTVLPKDILQSLGYSEATIQPYLTVDQNPDFVRINSTLRGPNPLGAMAVIGISLLIAILMRKVPLTRWQRSAILLVMIGLLAALWSSYSRSAWLAMVMASLVIVVAVGVRIKTAHTLLLAGGTLAVVAGGIYALRSEFVQHVIFHTNPSSDTSIKSDHEHLDSLQSGIAHTLDYPLGTGLGSVGSPSLLTESSRIVESQYFYIAAESGWLGLLLHLFLFGYVLWRLWQGRADAVALGLLASGIGMAIIGVVLPVWVDDTVGIIWWTLAGIAMARMAQQVAQGGSNARTNHKKAA